MRTLILFALALPAAASAQSIDGGFTPAMDPAAIGHGILMSNIPRQAANNAARANGGTRPTARAANATTTYRPTAAVSAKVNRTLIDEMEKRTAGAGAEMRQLLASGQAAQQYRKVASRFGFSPTDAADALAFYLVAQWGVATDMRTEVTPAQMTAVRRQVRERFPSIAGQLETDAKRQEFAETLATQGVVVAGIHEAAVSAGNEAQVSKLVAMARQGAAQMLGADPDGFALTDEGLVRVKG
jgi:hypothetical protein